METQSPSTIKNKSVTHLDKEQAFPPAQHEESNNASSKASHHRSVLKYGSIVVLLCCIAIGVALLICFARDDDDDNDENQVVKQAKANIEELLPSVNASNADVETALQNLTQLFLTKCPAGVFFAVTKQWQRLHAPSGVSMIEDDVDDAKHCHVDEHSLFEE